jgi:hypothetical protein
MLGMEKLNKRMIVALSIGWIFVLSLGAFGALTGTTANTIYSTSCNEKTVANCSFVNAECSITCDILSGYPSDKLIKTDLTSHDTRFKLKEVLVTTQITHVNTVDDLKNPIVTKEVRNIFGLKDKNGKPLTCAIMGWEIGIKPNECNIYGTTYKRINVTTYTTEWIPITKFQTLSVSKDTPRSIKYIFKAPQFSEGKFNINFNYDGYKSDVIDPTWNNLDFYYNTTADFDAGTRTNMTTTTSQFFMSANTLSLAIPIDYKDPNLVNYLAMNGNEYSQIGTNGSISGAVNCNYGTYNTWGYQRKSCDFTGGYIAMGTYNTKLSSQTNTLVFVMRPEGSNLGIYGDYDAGVNDRFWTEIWNYGSGDKGTFYNVGKASISNAYYLEAWVMNQWALGIWITNSTGAYVYRNGTLFAQGPASATAVSNNGPNNFGIGALTGTGGYPFNGQMSGWKLYNRTFSEAEMKELFNDGLNLYKAKGNWLSPNASIPVNYGLKSLTLNFSEASANNYIDKVEFYKNGDLSHTNTTDITSGTSVIYSENNIIANISEGNATFKIFVVGNLTHSLNITNVKGTVGLTGLAVLLGNRTIPDLTTLNAIAKNWTTTFNMSKAINDSSALLYYKTNSSSSNIMYYQNGTSVTGYFTQNSTQFSAPNYNFTLQDNSILPATYNLGEITIENTPHENVTLTGANQYAKMVLLNVSTTKGYNIFEWMGTNATANAGVSTVWYCNSSYVTGNPSTSANCVNFYTKVSGFAYNHTHTIYSSHHAVTLPISNGFVGNVKATSYSQFLFRGASAGNWNLSYIPTQTRTNWFTTTNNNGATWANVVGTVDMHLHQFDGTDSFWFYACAVATDTTSGCSVEYQDLLELGGLPPSAPIITFPINDTYTKSSNFPITYLAAVSPNAYPITTYNISLLAFNDAYISTIETNNSNFLSYVWNNTDIPDGTYRISVQAMDSLGQTSTGLSRQFILNNATSPSTSYSYYLWVRDGKISIFKAQGKLLTLVYEQKETFISWLLHLIGR